MIKYIIHIILFFFFTSVSALETVWSQGEESQVRIISPLSNIGEDKEIFLGIPTNSVLKASVGVPEVQPVLNIWNIINS